MYEQGEILIVPFPFSNLKSVRKRPVLVLSKKPDNFSSEDIITCGITSNVRNTKYSVLIDNIDLDKGEIPVKSRIKIDKLFTLDKRIVIKKIGKVNKITFSKIKEEFLKLV